MPANEVRQARLVPALAVSQGKHAQAHAAAPAAERPALAPNEAPAAPQVAVAVEQPQAPAFAMPLWLQQSGLSIAIKTPEPASPAAAATAAVNDPARNDDAIARLVKRGKGFMTDGDVVAARLLLQRAAEAGSAEAALALGASFDPLIMKQTGAIGVKTDAAQARQWYEKAAALGSEAASKQLAKLASAGQ
jgi:TPR repeat protein